MDMNRKGSHGLLATFGRVHAQFGLSAGTKHGMGVILKLCLQAEGAAVMEEFRVFLENPGIRKIWHNYSFDRHVLANHGIVPRGFGADTIHMARLLDSSRRGTKSYSLESLTG